jgi:hypothetical protein
MYLTLPLIFPQDDQDVQDDQDDQGDLNDYAGKEVSQQIYI